VFNGWLCSGSITTDSQLVGKFSLQGYVANWEISCQYERSLDICLNIKKMFFSNNVVVYSLALEISSSNHINTYEEF
jgi:hypothetical protein